MKKLLVPVSLIISSIVWSASGEDTETPHCADLASYHLLDFWLGDWDVFVGDELVGHNRIEKTMAGCAVLEHWTDSGGNEGMSLFFVDGKGTWKQIWVTGMAHLPGGVKEKTMTDMTIENGLRFQGQIHHPDVGNWLDRTTLTSVNNGQVGSTASMSCGTSSQWAQDWRFIKTSTETMSPAVSF